MENIKAAILEKLTSVEKQNMDLYWRVSDEQSELVNEHVMHAIVDNPEIAAFVANMTPEQLQSGARTTV